MKDAELDDGGIAKGPGVETILKLDILANKAKAGGDFFALETNDKIFYHRTSKKEKVLCFFL